MSEEQPGGQRPGQSKQGQKVRRQNPCRAGSQVQKREGDRRGRGYDVAFHSEIPCEGLG